MKKKILIGLGILAVVAAILMAAGVLKFKVGLSPSATNESALPEGWEKYQSGEFGYSVAYPSGWNISENNGANSREVVIMAPQNKAFVRIAAFKDEAVNSVKAVEDSIAEYKASFEKKETEKLSEFESKMDGDVGNFGLSGRMAVGDRVYQFLERGTLAASGRVLIMRGAVNTSEKELTQEEFDALGKTVRQIMDSFGVK